MDQRAQIKEILRKNIVGKEDIDNEKFENDAEGAPELFNAIVDSVIQYSELIKPENDLIGNKVAFYNEKAQLCGGVIKLVYTDAVASGTNQYCPVTVLLIVDSDGKPHNIYPRNLFVVTDVNGNFIPPDNGDVRWKTGSETFTREEVASLLWTQIAMISNDLKTHCGKELTPNIYAVIDDPRIPKF